MLRNLILALVLTLSGIPAMAVACDLLVCGDRSKAPRQNCHEQTAPQTGERVMAFADGCSHLATSDPYLHASSRIVVHPLMSTPPACGSADAGLARFHARAAWTDHGPPRAWHAPSFLPLRI